MLNNIFMWQANIVMYIINVIYLNEYIKSKFMRLCDYNASPVHCLGRKRKVLTYTIIHSFGLIGKNHGFISIEVSNAFFYRFFWKIHESSHFCLFMFSFSQMTPQRVTLLSSTVQSIRNFFSKIV